MSAPDSLPTPSAAPPPDRVRYERLALGLIVHGATAASPELVRQLARSSLWLETRNLLRQHGFTQAEIAELMGIHRAGCPCWSCVVALNKAVRKSVHKRRR